VLRPVRLGLVGTGAWGKNYIRAIEGLPDVHLAGTAGRRDWQALLDSDLHGVIIASPAATHADIAMHAMDRGLHVLIEKPLTLDVGTARALAARAREKHVTAMVEHTHLFHPAFRRLKSLLPDLGRLRAVRGRAGRIGPFRADASVLWDWGAHDVAMCLDLMRAKPLNASARRLERAMQDGHWGESWQIELEYPGAVSATLFVSNILSVKTRCFEVICEGGTLAYGGDALQLNGRDVPYTPALPLTVAVQEFAETIATGRADIASIDLGVAVVEVLESAEPKSQ
jgi:predicted dehydrogenase